MCVLSLCDSRFFPRSLYFKLCFLSLSLSLSLSLDANEYFTNHKHFQTHLQFKNCSKEMQCECEEEKREERRSKISRQKGSKMNQFEFYSNRSSQMATESIYVCYLCAANSCLCHTLGVNIMYIMCVVYYTIYSIFIQLFSLFFFCTTELWATL